MSTANLSLHLPDETELEAATGSAADSTADAAEAIEASEAATAVEEGDEQEQEQEEFPSDIEDDGFDGLEGSPEEDAIEEMSADDPEATLLEEPADDGAEDAESASGEVSDSTSPTEAASPLSSHSNRLTPHQPPKSAELVAFEHRLAEAKDRYVGASLYRMHLEGALKTAKENEKKALEVVADIENERVLNLCGRGEDGAVREIAAQPSPTHADAAPVDYAVVEGGSESPTADENAWRSVPTSVLFSPPIPRFGKTRQERLLDACPTIGDFEDKRALIGGLRTIEGIGEELADALKTRVLDWLSENRDKAVLAAAAAAGGEGQKIRLQGGVEIEYDGPMEAVGINDDGEIVAAEELAGESPAPTEAVEEGAAESSAPNSAGPDPRWHANIEARSQAIFFRTGDLSSVSPDDCLSQNLEDSRFWESGYEAYNAGNDLIDCPYVPGGERDDWLRGWMSAKLTNEEGWQGPGIEE